MGTLDDILEIGALSAIAVLLIASIDYTLHLPNFTPKQVKIKHIECSKPNPSKIVEKSYKTNDFSKDDKYTLMARLMLGETEGETKQEKTLIGYAVMNRVKQQTWYGKTINEVILKPAQYSCFNKGNPNLKKMQDPMRYARKEFLECLDVAKGVIDGTYEDKTQGADHFYNPKLCKPKWASKMNKIGYINGSKHIFLKAR